MAAAISGCVLGGSAAIAGAQDAPAMAPPVTESSFVALPNTGVGSDQGSSTDAMLLAVLGVAGVAGVAGTACVVAIKRSSR